MCGIEPDAGLDEIRAGLEGKANKSQSAPGGEENHKYQPDSRKTLLQPGQHLTHRFTNSKS